MMSKCAALARLLCILAFVSCGCSTADNTVEDGGGIAAELADGTYSCEVTNTTRGNGPYSLECEKSDSEIVIHFNNGGYITLDVDAGHLSDGETWNFDGSNVRNGDAWEVSINQ